LQKEADGLREQVKTVMAEKVKAEQERQTEINERKIASEENVKVKK